MDQTDGESVRTGAGRWEGRRVARGPVALRPGRARSRNGVPGGMIATALLGLTFVCYLTNAGDVQTTFDGLWATALRSVHAHDATVSAWFIAALPYIAGAFGLLLLYLLLGLLGVGESSSKPRPLPEEMTMREFVEAAGVAGVGPRVACEMYRLMIARYGMTMRSLLGRSFAELGLDPDAVWAMFEELTVKCGVVARGRIGIEALRTPMEMMQVAEQCVGRAPVERRRPMLRVVEDA